MNTITTTTEIDNRKAFLTAWARLTVDEQRAAETLMLASWARANGNLKGAALLVAEAKAALPDCEAEIDALVERLTH